MLHIINLLETICEHVSDDIAEEMGAAFDCNNEVNHRALMNTILIKRLKTLAAIAPQCGLLVSHTIDAIHVERACGRPDWKSIAEACSRDMDRFEGSKSYEKDLNELGASAVIFATVVCLTSGNYFSETARIFCAGDPQRWEIEANNFIAAMGE